MCSDPTEGVRRAVEQRLQAGSELSEQLPEMQRAILAGVWNSAYEIAKAGGKYQGWYLQQLKLTDTELKNGIRSFEKQIEKHQQWIAEPLTKIPDFGDLRPEQQRHLLEKKWPQDIQRHKDSIEILKGVLQERENGNI